MNNLKETILVEAKKDRKRIIIELNSDALDLFDELVGRTGSSSRAELFRNMLRYVAANLDDLEEGDTPFLKDKSGKLYRSTSHRLLLMKAKR